MRHDPLPASRLRLAAGLLATLPAAMLPAATIEVPNDLPSIQAAIDVATNGDEIVVAPGTYAEIIDLGGRSLTIRSSDGPSVTTIDATTVPDPGTGKPVIRCDSGESGVVIEGFTITGGTGNLGVCGGGLYAVGAEVVVRDCVFAGLAVEDEGGAAFLALSTVVVVDCRFEGNGTGIDGAGGAILANASDTTLERCDFIANVAGGRQFISNGRGGAIRLIDSAIAARCCRFLGNRAFSRGGAVYASGTGESSFTSCIFSGNVADTHGGAVYLGGDPWTSDIANCTFSRNHSDVYAGGLYWGFADGRVINSVFWENSDQQGMTAASQLFVDGPLAVTHSIVMGGLAGTGNLALDPVFVDADGADGAVGTADDDLRLGAGSPGIDSGDTLTVAGIVAGEDFDGNPRLADDAATPDTGVSILGMPIIDRGPFEFGSVVVVPPLIEQQPDSAIGVPGGPSVHISVVAPTAISYEWRRNGLPLPSAPPYFGVNEPTLVVFNFDASVAGLYTCDVSDGARTETSWSAGLVIDDSACPSDGNGDGLVDFVDLVQLLSAWGACLP